MAKKKIAPPPELPAGCSTCHGRAHIIRPEGGAGRCSCERGRALAAMDRERGIKSEAMAPAVEPQSGFEGDWS